MGATSSEPSNQNMLSPLGFRFQLSRTPKTNYFIQQASIPSLSLGEFDLDDPFVKLPIPGTKLRYDTLTLEFIVDEDLENYLEIHDWLKGLGFPDNYNQYSALQNSSDNSSKAAGVYSDGTLIILTSNHNANYRVKFNEMFPIMLSDLTFNSTLTDVDYLKASVTFRYRTYEFQRV